MTMNTSKWVTWCTADDCVSDGVIRGKCEVHADRCQVSECEHPAQRRKLCWAHYKRIQRRGVILDRAGNRLIGERLAQTERGLCAMPGCDREHDSRALCKLHYQRWWRYGDPRFTFELDDAGAFIDQVTADEILRRHDLGQNSDCDAYVVGPSWYWKKRHSMIPKPGAVPLAGNHRHAYRIFCQHQMQARLPRDRTTCYADDCTNFEHARGLCMAHYQARRRSLKSASK